MRSEEEDGRHLLKVSTHPEPTIDDDWTTIAEFDNEEKCVVAMVLLQNTFGIAAEKAWRHLVQMSEIFQYQAKTMNDIGDALGIPPKERTRETVYKAVQDLLPQTKG